MMGKATAQLAASMQEALTMSTDYNFVRARKYALGLICLASFFCLRVLGQLLVANFNIPFLPPMEEWFSGLMPYPPLLTCQILIVVLFIKINYDLYSNSGWFATSHARIGNFLRKFGSLYLFTMLLRYTMQMYLYPHERWFGGSIPIIFHCVLASYTILLGHFYRTTTGANTQSPIKRFAVNSLILFGITSWTSWQLLPCLIAQSLGLRPSEYAVRQETNVPVNLPDGVILRADIFHPQHINKTPTILVRIPFSKSIRNNFQECLISKIWCERGYTVVVQGTRGRAGSGGEFYPLAHDRDDGLTTLKWLAQQTWYNGQIVMWGGSASGHSQFAIANSTDPKLTAICVYESSTDFHEMFYPGGAFSLYSAVAWMINSQGKQDLANWPSVETILHACKSLPAANSDLRAVHHEVDFFRDWNSHTSLDDYWTQIDSHKTIQEPALLMAGWYDPFLPSLLEDWDCIKHSKVKSVATNSRLIIGPWTHGREVTFPDGKQTEKFRLATLVESLNFYDQTLHPAASAKTVLPVKIFVMGKNQWRYENEWPLLRTNYTSFFLKDSNSNCSNKFDYDPQNPVPTSGGAMIDYPDAIAKQNEIEKRQDVLSYTSLALTRDLEITGPLRAIMYVKTSARCTDFTTKLVDVYPDGRAYNVSDGILRHNFEPDKITKLETNLWPTSTCILKGHKIRVEISSSNFPRCGINPNTGENPASATATCIAHQVILTSTTYPSQIVLPIIPSPE